MRINLVSLYRALLQDLAIDRDTATYVVRRLKNEGLHFVSSILPAFSKHVLLCYEAGYWSPFGTSMRIKGGLPVFCRGYLKKLFYYDRERLMFLRRDDADPVAMLQIRQLCEYTYKLSVDVNYDVPALSHDFVATDNEVLGCGEYDTDFVDSMRKNFETHYPRSSKITDRDCTLRAHPGPGTFSGSTKDFYRRNHLPAEVNSSGSDYRYGLRLNRRAPNPTITSRDPAYSEVLFVPKDSRGPRVIVREPYTNLLFQMGFNSCLTAALERDTRKRINFVSQEINKSLAKNASITRFYATIDLKEASDRVSYAIVRHIFRHVPLGKFIGKFRTPQAMLPTGELHTLKKLSGMGSGYTFPVLALVSHLAICTQISAALKIRYQDVVSYVYVYGDDIIVPTQWYDLAVLGLTKVGLVTNLNKSYKNSDFRESCGGDYLYGNDVGPVRCKLTNARVRNNGIFLNIGNQDFGLLNIERHCRELVQAQHTRTAEYLYSVLESVVGPLPPVSGDSPVLGRYSTREVVLSTLQIDSTGLHSSESLLVARPVRQKMSDMCPYRFLLKSLNKVAKDSFGISLFAINDSSARYGDISIPRRVKVCKRKLSCFVRAG